MTSTQFDKPAFTLTVGELLSLMREYTQAPPPPIPQKKVPIRGIHGLAKFLGISPVTAQDLKNKKKVPYSQFGRVILFDPDKVMEALETNKKK